MGAQVALAALVVAAVSLPVAVSAQEAPVRSESFNGVTITTADVPGAGVGIARVDFRAKGSSVAFQWNDPALRFRFRPVGSADWIDVGGDAAHESDDGLETDHGEDGTSSRPSLDPVWLGEGTSVVEVEALGGDPTGLEALLFGVEESSVEPETAPGSAVQPLSSSRVAFTSGSSSTSSTQTTAAASPTTRTVNLPQAWGSAGWSYRNCPEGPTYMDRVDFAVIHHTASSNSYTSSQVDDQLRSIQAFHVNTRGWCDIAYNFMVDRFGQVWQARSGELFGAVQGGHSAGFNTGSVGISLLGDYTSTAPPAAMLTAAGDIAGWKLASFGNTAYGTTTEVSGGSAKWPKGQTVTVDRLTYHRNLQSTGCPGDQTIARKSTIEQAARRPAPSRFTYGRIGDVPLIGDWDGDRVETPSVRRSNVYFVRNSLTSGVADSSFSYGWSSDIPLSGDWDGDGIDTLGVFRNGRFFLRNSNSSGVADIDFVLGQRGDVPIAGDWDRDGRDEVGLQRGNQMMLWNSDDASRRDPGAPFRSFDFGRVGDTPFVGDWNHDGYDTVGLRRDRSVYINNVHAGGSAPFSYRLAPHQYPLYGHSSLDLPMPILSDGRRWAVGHAIVPT